MALSRADRIVGVGELNVVVHRGFGIEGDGRIMQAKGKSSHVNNLRERFV